MKQNRCFPHAAPAQAQTEHAVDWPERKPFLCRSSPLPMSGTDLGQSWLMDPQLPGGFLSGGRNACSPTVNTNTVLLDVPGIYKISIYSDVIIVEVDNSEGICRDAQRSNSMASAYVCCCVNTQSVCVGLAVVWDHLHPTPLIKKKKKKNVKLERVK